jgi:hypothetical protein
MLLWISQKIGDQLLRREPGVGNQIIYNVIVTRIFFDYFEVLSRKTPPRKHHNTETQETRSIYLASDTENAWILAKEAFELLFHWILTTLIRLGDIMIGIPVTQPPIVGMETWDAIL